MPVSLDEFERGIAPLTVRQVPEAVRTAKEEYRAYGSVAHATPSILFRVNRENPEPWSFAPYGYMQGGTTDGSGLFISVVFPNHMGVRIHGRNLDELLGLLLAHHVTWVEEFDPRRFDNPPPGAAIVTGIEIRRVARPEKPEGATEH